MATGKISRDAPAVDSIPDQQALSGLESRCLLKRIFECHEVLCQTILGAESAHEKAGGLAPLCQALQVAQTMIEHAEALAVQPAFWRAVVSLDYLSRRVATEHRVDRPKKLIEAMHEARDVSGALGDQEALRTQVASQSEIIKRFAPSRQSKLE